MIPHLRLASSFALTASLIAFVSASCGLDTSGTDTAGDDGSAPLDGSGSFDTSMPLDAQGGLDAHLGDSSAVDAAHPTDGSAPLDGSIDSSPPADSSPVCNSANGCIVVPTGWSLVAIETSQTDACPSGFADNAPYNGIEGATVGANACGCATCDVTTPPSCAAVAVGVEYDGFGCFQTPCGCNGTPNQNAHAGTCNTDIFPGAGAGIDFRFTPGPPAAGVCTAAAMENAQNVTYAGHDRICVQDSPTSGNCVGDQCTPNLPSPYDACIARPGHETCPAPFTALHDVGSAANYTCGGCGCTVATTAKCGGTMTYYTDGACTAGAKTFDADGMTCSPLGTGGFNSYIFTGTLGAGTTSCNTTPGAPADVTLANELTVCCSP